MTDAADMKSKLLSFIPCTPRGLQASNLTGSSKENVVEAFKDGLEFKPPDRAKDLLMVSPLKFVGMLLFSMMIIVFGGR